MTDLRVLLDAYWRSLPRWERLLRRKLAPEGIFKR